MTESTVADALRAHLAAGRLDEAEALTRREAEAHPSVARWRALAAIRHRRGKVAEALAALARAAALDPGNADVAVDVGKAQQSAGRSAEAMRSFAAAVVALPARVDVWAMLAGAALDAGDVAAAVRAVGEALARAPDASDSRLAAARVYLRQRRFADTLDVLAPLIGGAGANPAALELAGRAHAGLGADDAAAAILARGLAIDGQVRWARQIAFVLRRSGRVREGAAALAARLDDPRVDVRAAALPAPVWRGEPLSGRTIAVWNQLGIGDEIMMVGQLPHLRAAGATVVLEATPRLRPLLGRSMPWITVAPTRPADDRPDPVLLDPRIDGKIGIGDLDAWFPASTDAPRTAYLHADPAATARRRAAYRALGDGPIVGLSWRSTAPGIGPAKSTALVDWRPVLAAGPAVFVDLQYGDTTGERAAAEAATGVRLHRDPAVDPLRDLDAHAAQIAALDLVVSTSNSAAHLAGALGVPVWTLVPGPEGLIWYWGGTSDRTPWYASMRLIRPVAAGIDLAFAGRMLGDWIARAGRGAAGGD